MKPKSQKKKQKDAERKKIQQMYRKHPLKKAVIDAHIKLHKDGSDDNRKKAKKAITEYNKKYKTDLQLEDFNKNVRLAKQANLKKDNEQKAARQKLLEEYKKRAAGVVSVPAKREDSTTDDDIDDSASDDSESDDEEEEEIIDKDVVNALIALYGKSDSKAPWTKEKETMTFNKKRHFPH